MSKKSIEIFVGLFVLLGMAGLVFLALKAANLGSFAAGGGDAYAVEVRFQNVGGLKVRAPVRSAGVTVGRVVAIRLDPDRFEGVVTLELTRSMPFPEDSTAAILTAGLLGDQYVGLTPGYEKKVLQDRDVIPATRTQSAVVLEEILGKFIYGGAEKAGSSGGAK